MDIQVDIDEGLIRRLAQASSWFGDIVDDVVQDVSTKLRTAMQGRTPVGISKDSPVAKRSWTSIRENPLLHGARFSNTVPYASVLEFGSVPGNLPWRKAGPRTMVASGDNGLRIFSRQAPGGMFTMALQTDVDVEGIAGAIIDAYLTLTGGPR